MTCLLASNPHRPSGRPLSSSCSRSKGPLDCNMAACDPRFGQHRCDGRGAHAQQTRRVGLLKASGGTPAFVGVVLLAQNVMSAVAAALIGLVLSVLLTPSLASPGDGFLGDTPAPSLTITTIVIVIGVAGLVAMASTRVPAIKAARTSTPRPARSCFRASQTQSARADLSGVARATIACTAPRSAPAPVGRSSLNKPCDCRDDGGYGADS